MVRMFNPKKAMVIGVVIFILLVIQIESFAGEDWELITQLPTKRGSFSTAVVDDKIYIIGGTLFENFEIGPWGLSTVEVYDPRTNTWQRLANMPTPRESAQAAVIDGIIYVFGGSSQKRNGAPTHPLHVEAYNPATNTWTRKKKMPISRIYFGLGVVAGKAYLIGGSQGFGAGVEKRMDRVDIYDPATDTWEKGPKMLTRRQAMGVGVVSDRIYVIGGSGWPPAGWRPLVPVIEEYNAASHQWQTKKDMLDIKFWYPTVVVKDEIYLIGGIDDLHQDTATVDVYHPRNETWRTIPELPIPLSPLGAAAVKGKIYVFGGDREGREFVSDVLVFDTGFRAVEANGKLLKHWGELKAEQQNYP